MNNAQKIAEEIDEVTEGMARLDVVARPPKVHWGEKFLAWDDQKKLSYLQRFAEAMNFAADTIQKERDELGELLEKKERMLIQMQQTVDQMNITLQTQLTKMNQERQQYNEAAAQMQARIRELEDGSTI